MAASSGVAVLVLLLCCWRGAELQPIRLFPGPTTETMSSKSQEDIPGVFDEILVEDILDPNKSTFLETQRPLVKSTKAATKRKKAHNKANTKKMEHEKKFSAGEKGKLFYNEEDRETLYQIKSLAALEKIIESLRKALGNSLIKRRKYKSVFRGAKHHKGKQSLN